MARIAFTTLTTTDIPLHPDCLHAVQDAAALCRELGHEVVDAFPEVSGESMVQSFTHIWAAGCYATIEGWARVTGGTPSAEHFEPLTWALYEMGRDVRASEYLCAIEDFNRLARSIAAFFDGYDLLLTSTLGEPPVPLGTFDSPPEDPMRGFERAAEFVPYTPIANATGQPAMSVPLFWNAEELPIGAHFIGRFGDEATLFRLAAQLEEARPWAHKRPPISA